MFIDYAPKTDSIELDNWLFHLVDELRVPQKIEAIELDVVGSASINNFYFGNVGGWQVTESTIQRGVVIIDAATPKIQVDDIILDGANNLINVADKILLDADTELIEIGDRAGTHIHIDGANTKLESTNYVSGYAGAGFHLSPDLLEVGNIACRGIFRTAVFQKDVVSVVGGNLMVRPGDVLDVDMTALDASTLTIEGNETFAVGDFLRIKDGTDDEWLEVTNTGSVPTYTVTRDKDSQYGADANPAWKKGASVVNYGASGAGGVYMTASETNAPYLSVFTHAGSPWSAIATKVRLGNLNGFAGYSSDTYGLAIYEDANNYLKFDPTNGVRIAVSAANAITIKDGADINLEAGGDIIMTPSDTNPAILKWSTTHNIGLASTTSRGLCIWPSTANQEFFQIGYNPTAGAAQRYDQIKGYAEDQIVFDCYKGATDYIGLEMRTVTTELIRFYGNDGGGYKKAELNLADGAFNVTGCVADGTCEIFTEDALTTIRDITSSGTGIFDEHGHEKFDMEKLYLKYPHIFKKITTKKERADSPDEDAYLEKLGAKSDLLYRAVIQLDDRLRTLETE